MTFVDFQFRRGDRKQRTQQYGQGVVQGRPIFFINVYCSRFVRKQFFIRKGKGQATIEPPVYPKAEGFFAGMGAIQLGYIYRYNRSGGHASGEQEKRNQEKSPGNREKQGNTPVANIGHK